VQRSVANVSVRRSFGTQVTIQAAIEKLSRLGLKKAEPARKARQRYAELLALCPEYAAVIQDSRPILCSTKMLEFAGREEKDFARFDFSELSHPEDRDALRQMLQRIQEGSSDQESAELRFKDTGGSIRWLSMSTTRIELESRPAALLLARDITARIVAEQELRQQVERLSSALRALPDLVFEVDQNAHPRELPGFSAASVPPEALVDIAEGIRAASRTGRNISQYSILREGERRWLERTVSAVGEPHRPDARFVVTIRDMTQPRRMEEQAAQKRTMEAVGRLAGGIAHDFNNILQAVLGFCSQIREHVGDHPEVLRDAAGIDDSAQRAASLTHQLLAFSRKQAFLPVVRDLNDFLLNCEQTLAQAVGPSVALTLRPSGRPVWVNVDPSLLQDVLLNLAENARESIPGNGRLIIEVRSEELSQDSVKPAPEMPPGSYGLLSVLDTGIGMDSVTLSRIFEPFFTTKDAEIGSGLGLSLVYGSVRHMGGFIAAESTAGLGSCFRIYLPLIHESAG
jgi:PAS domain S-box-containing protein